MQVLKSYSGFVQINIKQGLLCSAITHQNGFHYLYFEMGKKGRWTVILNRAEISMVGGVYSFFIVSK